MNVLIVDDHNLFRSGLRHLLSDLDERINFLEAEGVEQVQPLLADKVDLTLLDMKLQGSSGLAALDTMRRELPECAIVILSGQDDAILIRKTIEAGASGFIPKSSTPEVLIQALRLVLAGGTYLPPSVLGDDSSESDAEAFDRSAADRREKLLELMSPRQMDSLLCAVQGKSNKVIARELKIAEGTVKLHLSAAFRALGVSNRTEAVFAVAEIGLKKK